MENLNIYQEYTLYQILMRIGTQPYIAITSDNDELLDTFINEITKRIVKVKKVYDYPHEGKYTTPEYLTKILTEDHDSLILMNFNKVIDNNIKYYLSQNRKISYDDAVYYQLIGFREYLKNASLIIPCSNKLTRGFFIDAQLRCFVQLFNLDNINYISEEEITGLVKRLRNIDYNQMNKEIEKHLW